MTASRNVRLLLGLASLLGGALSVSCGGSVKLEFIGEDDGGTGGSGGGDEDCGNGKLDGDETCDDRNTEDGDGCDAECSTEAGWVCNGEPSSCVRTCGNGKLDEGEACEDGNLNDGDGCDASCQIEGSCRAPQVIKLKYGAGAYTGSIDGSTSSGGNQVEAEACGSGDDVGAGADRVFEIELELAADLTVTLESSFNGLVRVLEKPCDTKTEVACRNAAGAGSNERLTIPNVPAGKYYIVVDGVNANAKGDFTVSVSAGCPLSNLKLRRLNFYGSQAELRNISEECELNLQDVGYRVESGNSGQSYELPDRALGPKESFTVTAYQLTGYNDFVVSPSYYANLSSGGFYLCRGECDANDGSNILDMVLVGASAPAIKDGLTFAPAALQTLQSTALSSYYVRTAYEGVAPDFLASDWRATVLLDPNINPLPYLYPAVSSATYSVVEDEVEGKVMEQVISTTSDYSGHDLLVDGGITQPTYFSYRYLDPGGSSSCYVSLGIGGTGSGDSDTWLSYRANVAYSYATTNQRAMTSGNSLIYAPATSSMWHRVEMRNIDWGTSTFDYWVDGVEQATGVALRPGHGGVIERVNFMPWAATPCRYTDVILY